MSTCLHSFPTSSSTERFSLFFQQKRTVCCWWVHTSSSSAFRIHLLPTSRSRVRKVLEAEYELVVCSQSVSCERRTFRPRKAFFDLSASSSSAMTAKLDQGLIPHDLLARGILYRQCSSSSMASEAVSTNSQEAKLRSPTSLMGINILCSLSCSCHLSIQASFHSWRLAGMYF